MKDLKEILAAADECFERGEYLLAEQLYEDALQRESMPHMGMVQNWILARGQASLAKARAFVEQGPDSRALHCLHVMALLKESEYEAAARAATTAICRFGSDPELATTFRGQRLLAHVELSRLREPPWDLIHEDILYLWTAYANAEKRQHLYVGIVERLLRLRGTGAPDVLNMVANELDMTLTGFADVLRSHAATLRLYADLKRLSKQTYN